MTNSQIKYKVALFIGRFQPFHYGHLYSLKKCFELAGQVIVGIGSSQESETENNPWDYETRKRMVELQGYTLKIVPVPDLHNDEKWGKQITQIIEELGYRTEEVVGIGNNDWTNRILRERGITVYESGLYMRDELEGIKIRELIGKGSNTWKERVPEVVVKCVEEYEKSRKSTTNN